MLFSAGLFGFEFFFCFWGYLFMFYRKGRRKGAAGKEGRDGLEDLRVKYRIDSMSSSRYRRTRY